MAESVFKSLEELISEETVYPRIGYIGFINRPLSDQEMSKIYALSRSLPPRYFPVGSFPSEEIDSYLERVAGAEPFKKDDDVEVIKPGDSNFGREGKIFEHRSGGGSDDVYEVEFERGSPRGFYRHEDLRPVGDEAFHGLKPYEPSRS